jgi:hypothetical protein
MKMFEAGYDSEGYGEIVAENLLPDAPPAPQNLEPTTMEENNHVTNEPPNEHVPMSEAEVLKLTIT